MLFRSVETAVHYLGLCAEKGNQYAQYALGKLYLCGRDVSQELALAAAEGLAACRNTAIFSVGSDGTDGPTDAAGGYCDENTKRKLQLEGMDVYEVLKENDAYHALKKTGGLIITGATGTNVNDVAVVLIRVSSKIVCKIIQP